MRAQSVAVSWGWSCHLPATFNLQSMLSAIAQKQGKHAAMARLKKMAFSRAGRHADVDGEGVVVDRKMCANCASWHDRRLDRIPDILNRISELHFPFVNTTLSPQTPDHEEIHLWFTTSLFPQLAAAASIFDYVLIVVRGYLTARSAVTAVHNFLSATTLKSRPKHCPRQGICTSLSCHFSESYAIHDSPKITSARDVSSHTAQ